jgi:hypothetical protein
MKCMAKLFSLIVVLTLFVFSNVSTVTLSSQALSDRNQAATIVGGGAEDVTTLTTVIALVANIIIGILAAVAVFYIINGAIKWMNNDPQGGQKQVVGAGIGLVVVLCSFLVVQFAVGGGNLLGGALGGGSGATGQIGGPTRPSDAQVQCDSLGVRTAWTTKGNLGYCHCTSAYTVPPGGDKNRISSEGCQTITECQRTNFSTDCTQWKFTEAIRIRCIQDPDCTV